MHQRLVFEMSYGNIGSGFTSAPDAEAVDLARFHANPEQHAYFALSCRVSYALYTYIFRFQKGSTKQQYSSAKQHLL